MDGNGSHVSIALTELAQANGVTQLHDAATRRWGL